jgi:hypothetical protein
MALLSLDRYRFGIHPSEYTFKGGDELSPALKKFIPAKDFKILFYVASLLYLLVISQ